MAKKGIVGEKLTNIALNMAFRCVFRRKIFKCKENMSPLPPQKFLSLGGGGYVSMLQNFDWFQYIR